MSYPTWHTYGYGFSTNEIEPTVSQIKELLSYAPNFNKEVHSSFSMEGIDTPTIDDYLSYDDGYYSGIAYLLQQTISEAEDIDINIAVDYDGVWYVLLCPTYPWAYTSDKERYLTMENMERIFCKYIKIFTDKNIEIDFQSIENGG